MQRSVRAPCHTGCNDMVFHQCESAYVLLDGYVSQNPYKDTAFVWHFLTMNFQMGYIVSRLLSQEKNLSQWIVIWYFRCTFIEKAFPHSAHGSGFFPVCMAICLKISFLRKRFITFAIMKMRIIIENSHIMLKCVWGPFWTYEILSNDLIMKHNFFANDLSQLLQS